MTPQEFKAWFDGFTEALDGTPNKDQWKRIKERVAEIDGKQVTERHYVDHYYRYFNTPLYYGPYCGGPIMPGGIIGCVTSNTSNSAQRAANVTSAIPVTFNATSAMYALGKAEGLSTTAGTPS